MDNNLLFVITIISAVASFALGVVVFFNDRKKYLNISFAAFTISLSAWAITVMMQKVTADVIWGRLIFVPIPFLVSSLLIFSIHFPISQKNLMPQKWQSAILFLTTILLAIIGNSSLVLKDVAVTSSGLAPVPGALLIPFYLICGVIALVGVYNLIKKYIHADPEGKLRMQYFIFGLILMMVVMVIMSLVLPLIFGTFITAFYAPSIAIILVAFTTLAIVRYRLMGIRFIAGKLLQAVAIGFVGFVLFNIIAIAHTLLWGGIFTPGALISGFLLTLIVAPLFSFATNKINNIVDSSVIYSTYNPYTLINKLLKDTSTELDLDTVIKKALDTARSAFGDIDIGVVLFDRESAKVLHTKFEGFREGVEIQLPNLLEVVQVWNLQESKGLKSEILVLSELIKTIDDRPQDIRIKLQKIQEFMQSEGVAVLLPLNRKVQLNGLMIVGAKRNNSVYTFEDISFLESIIANTSVNVGRALLYKEVQSFASTLKDKVNEQTSEITKQRDDIAEQLRKERDMMDILGHELRTPLAIARNAAVMMDMSLKKETKEFDSRETLRTNLDRILEHVRREVKTLETILSSTRIENNRQQINIVEVDCNDVVNDAVEGAMTSAKNKGLSLNSVLPETLLTCKADREKIQEVVDNLVDNAIKYTTKGSVTVKLEDLGEMVRFSVIDTGEGIPKEDIPNLGKKFFRSRMYLESSKDNSMKVVRPGGTGIGLYVVKGLLNLMNGRLEVESEDGKGSTFMVYFPK